MRVLIDPETGETFEVASGNIVGKEPYDYEGAHVAIVAASRERREVQRAYQEAQDAAADAEKDYRRKLAKAIVTAEDAHGKTNAQAHAKGTEEVAEAKRQVIAAEGKVRALYMRLELCSEDRTSLHRLIEWSRDVWRYEKGTPWGEGQ